MSSTSRIPAVTAALFSIFTTGLPAVAVVDGKWVTAPDGDFLTVGWTPDNEGSTGRQEWGPIGNRARNEIIDIPCYVDSYSGATDTATRRNAAFAILATVEGLIRADTTLGGVVPNPGWVQIGEYSERIEQTEAGLAVGVVFHIQAQARI